MKISANNLLFSTALGLSLLSATVATAGGFKFGGSGGGNKSGGNHSNNSTSSNNNSGNSNPSAFRVKIGGLGSSNSSNHSGSNNFNNSNSNNNNSNKKFNGLGGNKFNNNNNGNPTFTFGNGGIKFVPNNQPHKKDKYNNGPNNDYHDNYDGHCHNNYNCHRVRIYCVQPVDSCYYPYFSSCSVYPGDTYNSLSLRAYGMSSFGSKIANFNRLGFNNSTLVPGTTLQFPVVHPDGRLTKSTAAAHVPFATTKTSTTTNAIGTNNFQLAKSTTSTTSNTTTPVASAIDPSVPNVAVGSTLLIEGQSLGTDKGTVKLRFGGLAIPVEIVEWTPNATKIQLPTLDVTSPTAAELEVSLANGTLSSRSTIKLTPATTQVAASK